MHKCVGRGSFGPHLFQCEPRLGRTRGLREKREEKKQIDGKAAGHWGGCIFSCPVTACSSGVKERKSELSSGKSGGARPEEEISGVSGEPTRGASLSAGSRVAGGERDWWASGGEGGGAQLGR